MNSNILLNKNILKHFSLFSLFLFLSLQYTYSQGTDCSTADPFCTGTTYNFPNVSNGSTAPNNGNDYDCLGSQPNPVWYYMEVDQSGNINMEISQEDANGTGLDVDFILYGHYPDLATAQSECGNLGNGGGTSGSGYNAVVDCSFDPAPVEAVNITGAQAGEVYLVMITNYNGSPGTITFEQTGGSGSTDCTILTCNMTSLNGVLSACDPSTNTFNITGTIEFDTSPSTGQLIVEDCNGNQDVLNPPFVSPMNFAINNIPSDGTTNCFVHAYFTDDPTCELTTNNYDHPAPCLPTPCAADAGTYSTNLTGSSNSVGQTIDLCFGDQFDIISNGDNVDPDDIGGANPYDPGLNLLVFSCPPTVVPPADLLSDPCLLGIAGTADGAWGILNNTGSGDTYYYVPVTMYDIASGIYSNVILPNPQCYDLGPVYEVTYLPEITSSNPTEDCQAGTFTVTLNGGDPEVNGTNFTASNLTPASASFDNTTAGDGGTITISGLVDGDNYSFDVVDVNDCPITITGGPFTGPEDPAFSYAGSPWCQNATDPLPTITGDAGGTFTAIPAGLSINAGTGSIDLSASTPGVYDVTYTTPDPVCFDEHTVSIEVLPTPTVDPIGDIAVCHGDNVPAISFTGTPAGATFDWTNTQTSIGLGASGNGNIATFVGDNTSGAVVTGTVEVTPSANGCTGSPEDFTITINPLPSPTITAVNPLCENDAAVTLAGNPAGGTFSGTGVAAGDFDPATAGVGTHTITYDYTDGNTCSNSTTIDIDVNAVPVIDAGADDAICAGDPITLTATTSGGAAIVWDNGVIDGTAFNPAATLTYEVTATLLGCDNTDDVTITVNPLPTFTLASTDPTACGANDGTITIENLDPNEAYTITYDDGGVTVGPAAFNSDAAGDIVITGLNAGTYNNFIVELDASNCSTTDASNIVLTDPTPAAVDPIGDIAVCNGANVPAINFTSPDAGTTFAWTNNQTSIGLGANGNGNIATFVGTNSTAAAVTATITVTPTNNGCTGPSETFTITIDPIPAPVIDPVADLCIDAASVTLSALPAGGTFSGTGVTAGDFDPATAGAGVHVVTYDYTDANTCSASSTLNITVNALPTPSIDPVAALCLDDAPVTLVGNPAGGAFSGTGVAAGDFDPSVAGAGQTTVTYDYTDANTCSNSTTLDISVNPMEDASFSYDAATYCQTGGDPVLNITGTPGGTFSVVPAIGLDIDAAGNITSASSTIGQYDVTYTTPGTCSQSSTFSVTITDAPSADFVISEFHCNNAANAFPNFDTDSDGTPDGSGGVFTASPTGLSINSVSGEVDFTNSTPGTYTITNDINIAGCAQATATDNITIYELPTATISGNPVVCANDPLPSLNIDLTGSGPWSVTYSHNGTNVTQGGILATPYTITNAASGTYTLVSISDANCTNTAIGTATVTVNPNPTMTQTGPFTICEGSNLSLPLFTSNPVGSQFDWTSDSDVGFGLNGNGNIGTFTATSANGNIANVSVTPILNGCVGTPMVFIVNVDPLPQVSFTAPTTSGCVPKTIIFNNTSSAGQNCSWDFGDGTSALGCSSISHEYTAAGCYDVTLTVTSANGCVSQITYDDYVCLDENPVANFNYSPTPITLYDPVAHFENLSTGADTYSWNFFQYGYSHEENPSLTLPQVAGEYPVSLTVTTAAGCSDTKESIVFIKDELIFYVPNTFTPDGDSFNEIFKPVMTSGFSKQDYTLYIFNRWGEPVFESHNADIGWDGTYQGKLVQDGVYVWKIVLKDSQFDDRKEYMGHVNVLK